MRNLITGINGFAASHLVDYLLGCGEEVFGLAKTPEKNQRIRHVADRVEVHGCDIRARPAVKEVVEKVRPDRIYHMASVSYVPAAGSDWERAFETNLFGTLNLFDSVKLLDLPCRILCVGSAEEYGRVSESSIPIREDHPLCPVTLYGVGKASSGLLANAFVIKEGLDILQVRAFNHIGPRQENRFVCSSFAKQITEIERGKENVMHVGNLDSYRDFTDVRDTVRAYHAVMEKGEAGEVFNVCSGKSRSIGSMLEVLQGMSRVSITVEWEKSRYRDEKPVQVCGDHSFLTQRTGWEPEISIVQSLQDTLNYWREAN